MSKISKLISKARTLWRAAPTYLAGAAVGVTAASDEISKRFPGSAETVSHWAIPILAGLGAAIAIVRRVTPVLKNQRGL